MQARYAARTRAVMEAARREAARRGRMSLGPEDVLVALASDGATALAEALRAKGVTAEDLKREAEALFPGEGMGADRNAPYGPALREALDAALGEAEAAGSFDLEPVHLALALLEDPEGPAAKLLTELRVCPEALRLEVDALGRDEMEGALPRRPDDAPRR